jgi:hypothetical protein
VNQKECQPVTMSSKEGKSASRITRNQGKGKENDRPSSPFIDESEFDVQAVNCGSSRRKEGVIPGMSSNSSFVFNK